MTPTQERAFYDAAGFHTTCMSFDIKLFVGGIALICGLFILAGLMHLLNSNNSWDKMTFLISIFSVSFILMLIFTYCA